MPAGLQLRVNQLTIHRDFITPALRGDQRDLGDLMLDLLEQIGCQTDSPLSVVSDFAVLDTNFVCHFNCLR
jgi:hypothetical protein